MVTVKQAIDTAIRYNYVAEDSVVKNNCIQDGDLEYQFRGHGFQEDSEDAELKSILVRFICDPSHSYIEFFLSDFPAFDALITEAFSYNTIDTLERMECDYLRKKGNKK